MQRIAVNCGQKITTMPNAKMSNTYLRKDPAVILRKSGTHFSYGCS